MDQATVTVEIPVEIYEQAESAALDTRFTAERLMQDVLRFHFDVTVDTEISKETLPSLSDSALWAVVQRRLTPIQQARLHELLELGNMGTISEEQEVESRRLVDLVENQMLLRSKALVLLKRRGLDINLYLESAV